jgi:hypothetical protein
MSAPSPIRFNAVTALAVILLAMVVISANRNTALRIESARLKESEADLRSRMTAAVAARDKLREETAGFPARLIAATNAAVTLAATQYSQIALHDKLRGEIARLSEDNVLKESQLDALRAQSQEFRDGQYKAESLFRNAQNVLAATSNEVTRLRASDTDKSARLALREQELAAKVAELTAAATARQQLETQKAAADQVTRDLQAKLDAGQAELTALKARVTELEAGKDKAVVPPTVTK